MNEMDNNQEAILLYLGLSLDGWRELLEYKQQNRYILPHEILEEIARLRGKINFYESRIKQMHSLAKVSE